MADPLSIAGLAAGLVSLGLQVAGGLSNYLNAVKGRSEELRSVKQQATDMKDRLLVIQDLLPQVKNNWPTSANMVENHLKSCNFELNALWTFLSELSQPSSSGSGIQHKLAEQKKTFKYPFNRSHINSLEDRLIKANNALQSALQATELAITIAGVDQTRQLHDTMREVHDMLSAMRRQNGVTSSSSIAPREVPQRLLSYASGTQLESIKASMALASRPSLLSASIQSLQECERSQEEYDMTLVRHDSASQICSCSTSRKTSQHRSDWRYFSLIYGTSNTTKHRPGCKFLQFDSGTQSSNFAVQYGGLKGLFQTAIFLSFVYTRGAGGRSISSTLAYYPIVDRRKAPVFRIIDLVNMMLQVSRLSSTAYDIKEVAKAIQRCYDSILILFSKGKASPKDLDLSVSGDCAASQVIISGIDNLVACGAPLDARDNFGSTAWIHMWRIIHGIANTDIPSWAPLFMKLLPPSTTEVIDSRKKFPPFGAMKCLAYILHDARLAEAFGCGPLSLAARAGDRKRVADIIKRHPQSLNEVNEFGHTAVHLALNQPLCLRIILEASKASIIDISDDSGRTPIDYACRLGYRMSTQILISFGCRLKLPNISQCRESSLDDILIGLVQRREELKRLGLENLSETEAKSLRLYESTVLDSKACSVQELLRSKGVNIPSAVVIPQYDSSSVYHWASDADTFDKLWACGFRDINNFNILGGLPLIRLDDIKTTLWLIEHGADYWTPLGERNAYGLDINKSITPAHLAMSSIGSQLVSINWRLIDIEAAKQVAAKLFEVRVSDACSCECSVGGCTILSAIFDWRHNDYDWLPSKSSSPSLQTLFRDGIWDAIQGCQSRFRKEDTMGIIRRTTFDSLKLMHTCCRLQRYQYLLRTKRYTPEEVDEINSEQATLLAVFADLLIEFETIAYEDRNGAPLIINDPEEFWIRRWLPRIREILNELDGNELTEEEISAAEAIGVVWGPLPAEEETPEPREENKHGYTPEYVMRRIEEIMNE
ncbi:hypothetical protein F5Y14DRAFT_464410 [Nemania sp. NC0429]|nr:hypothetical protein F5Y14DRAFT_464410 [Nemania sp. NC0429]